MSVFVRPLRSVEEVGGLMSLPDYRYKLDSVWYF